MFLENIHAFHIKHVYFDFSISALRIARKLQVGLL